MLIKGVPLATKSRSYRERPALVAGRITGTTKPTAVVYGAFGGYSFPIYNSDDEEMFLRHSVPRRWDGTTNPLFHIHTYLASAETIGKKFQFQASWFHVKPDATAAAVVTTVNDVPSGDVTLTDDDNDQYKIHCMSFTIDLDVGSPSLLPGNDLVIRLRRIANTGGAGSEISGEVVVYDWFLQYTIDKAYSA